MKLWLSRPRYHYLLTFTASSVIFSKMHRYLYFHSLYSYHFIFERIEEIVLKLVSSVTTASEVLYELVSLPGKNHAIHPSHVSQAWERPAGITPGRRTRRSTRDWLSLVHERWRNSLDTKSAHSHLLGF